MPRGHCPTQGRYFKELIFNVNRVRVLNPQGDQYTEYPNIGKVTIPSSPSPYMVPPPPKVTSAA